MAQEEEKASAFVIPDEAVDVSIEKDGGVRKLITKEGHGCSMPGIGDEVTVHYTGKLTDGTKFDSSVDRGQPFEFKLGQGQVIKAWDQGVASMKQGEHASLYCSPEYAYGKAGSPPKIPPDSTLIFEVELISWKGEDVTSDKDGGVIKHTLKKGEGYSTPNDGATVKVHVVGRHEEREFDNREVEFALGDGYEVDVPAGVELCLQKMKKGERVTLNLNPSYGFGKEGLTEKGIPAFASLDYDVELISFEKAKEGWEMELPEKLDQAEIYKAKGTALFKSESYDRALVQYRKMTELLDTEEVAEGGEEHKERTSSLRLAAHLNIAITCLKLSDATDALKACDEALRIDPCSEKGLFRRGLANLERREYEEADYDFRAVLEIAPKNKAAQVKLALTHRRAKEEKAKEKKLYGGMFAKFAQQDNQKAKEEGRGESEATPGDASEAPSADKNGEVEAEQQTADA